MPHYITEQNEWHHVVRDLEAEEIKLASYDKTLIPLLGDVREKNILDFGSGPGVLCAVLQKLGANVKAYDINPQILADAAKKIGKQNVYEDWIKVPQGYFDILICNLVLCIVTDAEAIRICEQIQSTLAQEGYAYIGFCNPKIFDIRESKLDFRFPTGNVYGENHSYRKVKKEGKYVILETHRPIDWYKKIFAKTGLELVETFYTPEYELGGKDIQDFIIFKLKKCRNL
ncbi:MAG TPA: class I SAM-dependent methyltransferase [Patescibacteria group bacterium]|nr:class I SAM-dependent methyltransferase [Patescibacteria group bacterium]